MTRSPDTQTPEPALRTVGIDGMLVQFADHLTEEANRAALAFRAAVDRAGWDGIEETSTSLVSAYVRFDPLALSHEALTAALTALLSSQDWYGAAFPEGRRRVTIPTVYGGDGGPQLAEAAAAAGLREDEAIAELSAASLTVQTLGFAPGMPYLGALPGHWDIPRQTDLTPQVPAGALCVAIRQCVLFPVSMPTGWRHVGQTAARLFRPEADDPFLLRPGDVLQFPSVSAETLDRLRAEDAGATVEPLT